MIICPFILIFIIKVNLLISIKLKLKSYPLIYDPLLEDPSSIFRSIPITIPTVSVCFGIDHDKCFTLAISNTIAYTFLESSSADEKHFNNHYNVSLTQSLIKGIFMIRKTFNNTFFGYISKEVLDLTDHHQIPSKPQLAFFLFDTSQEIFDYPFDGYVGLRKYYHLDDEFNQSGEYSLLAYLCNTKQIEHSNFSIKYNLYKASSETENYIEFDVKKEMTYPKCRLVPYTGSYYDSDCSLSEVIIGNESNIAKVTNEQVVFNTLLNLIVFPIKGLFIFEYIIRISDKKCALYEEKNFVMLKCNIDTSIRDFPDVKLRMGVAVLVIKWANVMKKINADSKEQMYMSMIILDKTKVNNLWIIGLPGFIDYEIIFDNNDRSIGFIYTPGNYDNQTRNAKIIMGLIIMIIITLLIGVCIMILIKKK